MSILHRAERNAADEKPAEAPATLAQPHQPVEAETLPAPAPGNRPDGPPPPAGGKAVPRTRISVAWVSIWTAAVVFIALIVFILQNTRGVKVSYLGLHGTLPLAMALLIAAFGGVLLTLVIGTARITQLRRRLARGRRN